MKKNNKINLMIIGFLMIFFSSSVFAMDLDELINSYDFDVSSVDLQVSNISFRIENVNNISQINSLVVSFCVNSTGGDYIFNSKLSSLNGNFKVVDIDSFKLDYGMNLIEVVYELNYLKENDYVFGLEIFDKNGVIFKNNDLINIIIDNEDNFIGEIEVVDFDYDQYDDGLNLVLEVENIPIETKKVIAHIESDFGLKNLFISSEFDSDVVFNSFELNFNSSIFFDLGDGEFKVIDLMFTENNYSYVLSNLNLSFNVDLNYFNEIESRFLNDFIDVILYDGDSNFKYDNLTISTQIYVHEIGEYKFELLLVNEFDDEVIRKSFVRFFDKVGISDVEFIVEGEKIYKSHLDGPYLVKVLSILKDDVLLDSITDVENEVLNDISYVNFEIAPLADLLIENVTYNNVSGEVNLIVKNNGSVDAIGFVLKIVGVDFENLYEGIVSYIKVNESSNFNFFFDVNLNDFYVYLDYYNTIEEVCEKNNIVIYSSFNGSIHCVVEDDIINDKEKDKDKVVKKNGGSSGKTKKDKNKAKDDKIKDNYENKIDKNSENKDNFIVENKSTRSNSESKLKIDKDKSVFKYIEDNIFYNFQFTLKQVKDDIIPISSVIKEDVENAFNFLRKKLVLFFRNVFIK